MLCEKCQWQGGVDDADTTISNQTEPRKLPDLCEFEIAML
jgi:hypothetical protein